MDETNDKQDTPQDVTPSEPSADKSGITPQTETKTYSEEELNKRINDALSAKGRDAKRLTEWETSLANQQKQLQEFQTEMERQRLEREQAEIDSLSGDPDAQSRLRKVYQREDALRRKEAENEEKAQRFYQHQYDATQICKQYGLSFEDYDELLTAKSRDGMELKAIKMVQERQKLQPQAPKKEPSGFKPDSGTSDAGGDDDAAFLKRWNSGEEPATKQNLQRAQKILNK